MTSVPNRSPQEVDIIANRITALELSEEDTALLLAGLYMATNHVKKAIKVLEDINSNGSQSPGVNRILGDIYHCTHEDELAQRYYRKAMNLTANNLCVEQLAARTGLAQLEARKNRFSEVQTQRLPQDIENDLNNLASGCQKGAIELAIKKVSSIDMELANKLTSLTIDCPIKGCSYAGERVRDNRFTYCRTCGVD